MKEKTLLKKKPRQLEHSLQSYSCLCSDCMRWCTTTCHLNPIFGVIVHTSTDTSYVSGSPSSGMLSID